MPQVFEIRKLHHSMMNNGYEAPLYINGKATGDLVRLMPIYEDKISR